MARYTYERLTFLDESFLMMEQSNSPMHVAGVATFDAGSLRKANGGIDIDRIRSYVSSRLHLIPRYRQRLAHIPIEGRSIWVDDEHFNIHYHVRHTALPKPGDERQLKRLAARVMSQHLDRSKPLWEIWFVEGLEHDDRFAMISKVHHCMVDGMSTVDLLGVLLQTEPREEHEPTRDWIPRPVPGAFELIRDAALRYAGLPFGIGQNLPGVVQQIQDPRSDLRSRLRALRDTIGDGFRPPSETPLNQPIGPHRRFDWLSMDLAKVKEVKNKYGVSLNDVVLATVAGAVRSFLQRRRVNVDVLDFRVMAPVSMRTADEHGTLGNRVSAWIVPMPLDEKDPRVRIRKICETTSKLKQSRQALGAEMLTQVGEWTPSTLLALGARMATRALPFNLVVTNVPGPQVPLYMLSAKMRDSYGLVPLLDNLCLGIVLFSYAGKLCWGFTCDWDLLPDLHDFVIATERAFQELRNVEVETAVKRKPVRTRSGRRRPRVGGEAKSKSREPRVESQS